MKAHYGPLLMQTSDAIRTARECFRRGSWQGSIQAPMRNAPARSEDDAKQRLRLQRFLLASTFSLLYVLVLSIFYTQAKIDGPV